MIPARLQPLVEETRALADRFAAEGFTLYLVGGVVRDAILGRLRDGNDLDFTTDASPDDIERIVRPLADAVWLQGKRFGTIGAKRGELILEITTHRAEAYAPDSRKPDVEFSTSIDADLSRRDFTVNAMALRLGDERFEARRDHPSTLPPRAADADSDQNVVARPSCCSCSRKSCGCEQTARASRSATRPFL